MLRFVQIDSFTSEPFKGNPAVVVEPVSLSDDQLMQDIAREMNVAETAFLAGGDGAYGLRWFTPVAEVDLCGHATLASAHALWTEWNESAETIRFATRSGELRVTRRDGVIWMDFPSEPVEPIDESRLATALGIAPVFTGANRMDYFVEAPDEAGVRSLRPDFRALLSLGKRGVIVSARSNPGSDHDFVSRFFAPAFGIDEDPVTGSAHCALAPYWSESLGLSALIGYQASDRGGYVRVRIDGDRVHLGGEAVTVFSGEMKKEW